jgi:hypothetical protein
MTTHTPACPYCGASREQPCTGPHPGTENTMVLTALDVPGDCSLCGLPYRAHTWCTTSPWADNITLRCSQLDPTPDQQ